MGNWLFCGGGSGGGGGPTRMALSFDFGVEARILESKGGSGTWTINRDGMKLATGATSGSRQTANYQIITNFRSDFLNPEGFFYGMFNNDSAVDSYFRWFSSNTDATVGTAHQIGIDFNMTSGFVETLSSSSGDGTVEQLTTIAGTTPGTRQMYRFVMTEGAGVDFWVNGALKNTHATRYPGASFTFSRVAMCDVNNTTASNVYLQANTAGLTWEGAS